jgi:hypothetical protein
MNGNEPPSFTADAEKTDSSSIVFDTASSSTEQPALVDVAPISRANTTTLVSVTSFSTPKTVASRRKHALNTPLRLPWEDSVPSPLPTPAWLRPFHLVDDEQSIYMNRHGED